MTYRSPLLDLPGAVAAEAPDTGVAAHYGSFNVEQRQLVADEGFVDLSHRPVLRISGPDRLTWLHSLTSQWFEAIPAGRYTQALILSPQGHVEHYFAGVDDGEAFIAHTEPGGLEPLVTWLNQMKFMTRVEVTDAGDDFALVWRRGEHHFIPRADLRDYAAVAGVPCGLWAYEALRIAAGNARMGLDTDHRSIPNEMGWLGSAVHLEKGCYRGQETVARRLNRSLSTLQRQLQAEGLSYRQVIDQTRHSLARAYLGDKRFSQAEIAYLLGFSDQSSFSRAYRRWTGQSPGRAEQRSGPVEQQDHQPEHEAGGRTADNADEGVEVAHGKATRGKN